jgi:ribosomal-protein-alanine N-acetyltransferase
MRIVPMTATFAADIATWEYAEPYAQYSLSGADPDFFTDPDNGYTALVDDGGELIGYRSFGADGQVPGYAYDDSALDTGGGLRPSLTGRGLGRDAIATGLAYGRERFAPRAFRVTVASFNARAQRVVTSLGFEHVDRFEASTDGQPYDVFVRVG